MSKQVTSDKVLIPAGPDRWIEAVCCDDAPALYNATAWGSGWPSTKYSASLSKKQYNQYKRAFTAESVPLEVLLRRAAVWAGR